MDCNKKCYWNYENQCVYEDELKYDEGKPQENETCPNWLRHDFDNHFNNTVESIKTLIRFRNIKELEEIESFILNQRKGEK